MPASSAARDEPVQRTAISADVMAAHGASAPVPAVAWRASAVTASAANAIGTASRAARSRTDGRPTRAATTNMLMRNR
jgi:hypothetical protein